MAANGPNQAPRPLRMHTHPIQLCWATRGRRSAFDTTITPSLTPLHHKKEKKKNDYPLPAMAIV